jgi:hypothetical protein
MVEQRGARGGSAVGVRACGGRDRGRARGSGCRRDAAGDGRRYFPPLLRLPSRSVRDL